MGFFQKRNEKKQKLLEWQKVILENSPGRLTMTEKQLKQSTYQRAENDLRIINDCRSIMSKTVNPETFFTRLDLLKQHAFDLVVLEKYISFSGASPTQALKEIDDTEQDVIYQFIVNYFSDVVIKAEKLKTERGKKKRYQNFYDSLLPYFGRMNEQTISYIEYRCRDYL